jgi:hypothetical protein
LLKVFLEHRKLREGERERGREGERERGREGERERGREGYVISVMTLSSFFYSMKEVTVLHYDEIQPCY